MNPLKSIFSRAAFLSPTAFATTLTATVKEFPDSFRSPLTESCTIEGLKIDRLVQEVTCQYHEDWNFLISGHIRGLIEK